MRKRILEGIVGISLLVVLPACSAQKQLETEGEVLCNSFPLLLIIILSSSIS